MRTVVLALLLASGLALSAACSDGDDTAAKPGGDGPGPMSGGEGPAALRFGPKELAPGVSLPRVGTIGDYPKSRVIVNLDAEGKLIVKNETLDLSTLKALLLERAETDREPDAARASRVHAVLRIDRTVPWRAAAWLMQTCADPSVRIYRLHFAVLPEEGDEEGTLAAFLPKDRGLASTIHRRGQLPKIEVALKANGPSVEPSALYARVKEVAAAMREKGWDTVQADVNPDPLVPVGYLIRVLDVLHRAGIDEITFRGTRPPASKQAITELIADARIRPATPGIRLFDQMLRPSAGDPVKLPPVARVRDGLAGNAPGCGPEDDPVELHARVDEEPPELLEEKPIEQEDKVIEDPVIRDAGDSRDMPHEENLGEKDFISDAPFDGPSTNSEIGIGGGAGGAFGGRRGHRDLVVPGGGGKKTEDAVGMGLEWLKDHQDPDGFWDCDGFGRLDKAGTPCDGPGNPYYDTGVSGLALLAFLGAGETHKAGVYKKTVKNGLKHLKQIQDPEGCFGARTTNHFVYNHAIGTLTMAEAYGLTLSPLYKQSAQQGVDFVLKCRNPYLAWRYGVRSQDNDTSVSGWMVMALKSGKGAGLRVDPAGFEGMKAWLDKVTEPEYGRVGYTVRGNGPARPQDLMDRFPPDKSESMTAMGILSRVFLGEDPADSEMIAKGAKLCLKALPVWDVDGGSIDMYYWYHGTMAMFQVGGEGWRQWNTAMKKAVIDHQRKDGNFRGSWDPAGPWGREGGRVYSTALMVLCMEVYYRYPRAFGARGR